MKYKISKLIFGHPGSVDLNEEDYLKLNHATENLLEGLFIEEKFDILIENYYEYEVELLSMAARMMIYEDEDYFSMSSDMYLICRRIANLMSACRMYLDHVLHHISNIYGKDSEIFLLTKNEKKYQYDNNLGYRVIEEIRNYAQHRDLPIQNLIFSRSTVNLTNTSRLLHTVIPLINVSVLKNSKKLKKSILDELITSKNKNEIDIRPIIRDYIECIGKIHDKIRDLIKPDTTEWENLLNQTINKARFKYQVQLTAQRIPQKVTNNQGIFWVCSLVD